MISERTEDFWAGQFGNEYLQRNQIDPASRKLFWQSVVEYCQPASMLEVGCNRGHNLVAIQQLQPGIDVHGVDINAQAIEQARQQGIEAQLSTAVGIAGLYEAGSMDLVFTAGVLIHIAPADLEATMRAIIATSGRYVMAIEYESAEEEEVEYRGHAGKLWRRPYGQLYQQLGLRLMVYIDEADGFDRCACWLLEKAQ